MLSPNTQVKTQVVGNMTEELIERRAIIRDKEILQI